MIIVKINGGLGNQMFQYALARRLSIINDCSINLFVCQRKYSHVSNWPFQLNKFDLNYNLVSPFFIKIIEIPFIQ